MFVQEWGEGYNDINVWNERTYRIITRGYLENILIYSFILVHAYIHTQNVQRRKKIVYTDHYHATKLKVLSFKEWSWFLKRK